MRKYKITLTYTVITRKEINSMVAEILSRKNIMDEFG
jgi:hypothetical protein